MPIERELNRVVGFINRYHASLKILVHYGKALDAKFVAASTQLATVPVIRAQIRAAKNAAARWAERSGVP